MDEIKYIVAPNKSIATKVGVIGPGKEVTPKIIGPNFNTLVAKGLIIKEEDLKFKNEVEKSEMNLAKSERVVEKAKSEQEPEEEPVEKELTKKEIKEILKEKNIEFNDKANKNDLLKLLNDDKPEFGAKKTEETE